MCPWAGLGYTIKRPCAFYAIFIAHSDWLWTLAVGLVVGAGLMTSDARWSQRQVLGLTTAYPLSPAQKGAPGNVLPHELNNSSFGQAELALYGLKGRSVFPGHLDDPADIACRQRIGELRGRIGLVGSQELAALLSAQLKKMEPTFNLPEDLSIAIRCLPDFLRQAAWGSRLARKTALMLSPSKSVAMASAQPSTNVLVFVQSEPRSQTFFFA